MACFVNIFVYAVVVLVFASCLAHAVEPTQRQDFCVGDTDPNNPVFCKSPEDFLLTGLDVPRNTNNRVGSNVTLITPTLLPGLNNLGITLARADYGPYGHNPPHIHPHANELIAVMEGTLYVGFITNNIHNCDGGQKMFTKILSKGDVFAFPQGLIHFQYNIGNTPAMALSVFSSQNPGLNTIRGLWSSRPYIT